MALPARIPVSRFAPYDPARYNLKSLLSHVFGDDALYTCVTCGMHFHRSLVFDALEHSTDFVSVECGWCYWEVDKYTSNFGKFYQDVPKNSVPHNKYLEEKDLPRDYLRACYAETKRQQKRDQEYWFKVAAAGLLGLGWFPAK